MGLFQPITNTSHLPQVGANAENLALDLKQTAEANARILDLKFDAKPDHFERAKDVAAFANASGGVILVGAAEDKTRGILGKYWPLERQEAKRVCDAFNLATRDLCSPAPIINPVVIDYEDKFVVAVNVWPFPGQAVGVRIKREPPSFVFPFRTGVETRWLTAEQLPMLMVPEIRRITILLDAIPTGAKVSVLSSTGASEFTLLELQALENVVVLQAVSAMSMLQALAGTKSEDLKLYLPIDAIRSVWKAQDEQWRIIVEGELSAILNGVFYEPPSQRK